MLALENIKLALLSIKANKMRSFLTMLGIIIGISSVIAISSIGSSMKAAVEKEFESFGKDNAYIYVNWSMIDDYMESSDLITTEEIDRLLKMFPNELKYAAPWLSVQSDVKVGSAKGKINVQGISSNYDSFKPTNLIHGRMINQSDVNSRKPRIVVEKRTAMELFNTANAVGKSFTIMVEREPVDFTIVGVYEEKKSIFSAMGGEQNYSGYAPYSSLTRDPSTTSVDIYLDPNVDKTKTLDKITNYLCKMKNKPQGFYMIDTAESQLGMINSMLSAISLAIGAIAAISLVVGGIGIMNIMLVSVTERTREIGIRKSLGARTKDVMVQFLIESMILSATGGIIGTIFGLTIAVVGTQIAGVGSVIEVPTILMAVGFSALVGVFFGMYPAKKAAKLDPIEALRYE